MNPTQLVPNLCWIGLGIFVMVFSYRLELGDFSSPKSGLMSFLLGAILTLLSLCGLVLSLRMERVKKEARKEAWNWPSAAKIVLILIYLFAYAFVLERLGFLITTWLFLFMLFKSMGNRWITTFVASTITVLATYSLFTYFGVRFPHGIFR